MISGLDDPHIVSVMDYAVTEEGNPYLVMELLHGQTLADRLEQQPAIALDEALDIAAQVASGLAAAHAAGIVHRDLKPANIFLVESQDAPFVKLVDFGISKRTSTSQRLTLKSQLLGTPHYMAPEQAAGRIDAVSPATDQFALAVIVYEMLTGEQPFGTDNLTQTLLRVLSFDPPPPSQVAAGVPSAVDVVLARALSKNEQQRFAVIKDFTDALFAAVGYEPRRASSAPRRMNERRDRVNGSDPKQAATEPATDGGLLTGLAVHRLLAEIDAARVAFVAHDVVDAAHHAQAALSIAQTHRDPVTEQAVRISESLLDAILLARVGSEQHRVSIRKCFVATPAGLCPKEAFLLSRIERDVRVEELLDIAAMPRLEALATLATLVDKGAVRTTDPSVH
jgi:hypothetical protein